MGHICPSHLGPLTLDGKMKDGSVDTVTLLSRYQTHVKPTVRRVPLQRVLFTAAHLGRRNV